MKRPLGMLLPMLLAIAAQAAPVVPNTIYDHSEPIGLPELMRTSDGGIVSSVADWESLRRPEILNFFTRNVYGERPVERPADIRFEPLGEDCEFPEIPGVRKRVRISFSGPRGKWSFNACVFVPKGASSDKPVPAFLLVCNRALDRFADVDRKVKSGFFPVEEIVRRGYAAAVFKNTELALDDYHPSFAVDGTAAIQDPPFTNGLYACWAPERTQHSWGAISVWAWGASRVLDWLEIIPGVDARRVAVVGHSRGGKTALWAGASDARFAMVCANDSGCCGAKLNHVAVSCSETIRQDNVNNPHWFCRAFRRFNGRDFVLPYDQHWLAALVAPRLLYIASASEDSGAGPWGEFLTARHASSAWILYGKKGLIEDHPYVIEDPFQKGCVGYHLRKGGHDLTSYDWNRFMDFADCHLRWRWLDPPRKYSEFERKVVRISRQETPDYDIECYEQANGPGTRQRVMMVIPRGASGSKRLPAVVVPYYFVEGTIGREFDGTPLPHYTGVAFAADLAKRGFVCITADAYHLTYLRSSRPRSDFGRWDEAASAFNRDWPEWSGIGKLAFDTRLLVDVLASDPRVDSGRIGIMGHSLGGKMAFYAGCLDPRIKVIVASDFGIGWDQTNWDADWYWGPVLEEVRAQGFDNSVLLEASGGKPFCLIAGKYDNEDSGRMVRRVRRYARTPSLFNFVNHATGHRPPRWATEEGYRFLDQHLKCKSNGTSADRAGRFEDGRDAAGRL